MTDYLNLKKPRTLPDAKDGLYPAAPTPPAAASSSPTTRAPIGSRAPVAGASGTPASLETKASDGPSPAPSRVRENIAGGQSDVLDDVNSQASEQEDQEADNFLDPAKMFDEEMDTELFLGFANHLFKNYEILNEDESLIDYLPQGFDRIILYKLIAAWCMNVDISVFHFLKERRFEEIYVSEQLNKRLIEYIQDKGELGAKVATLMEDCENINNEVEEIKDGSLKIVADYVEASEKKMQELLSQIQTLTNQISSGGVGAVAGPGVAGSVDDAAGPSVVQGDSAESGRMDSDNTLSDHEAVKDRISPGKYVVPDQGESAADANVEIDGFKRRYDSLIEKLNRGTTPPPHRKKKSSLFWSRNRKARKDEALSALDKFKCALLEKDLSKRQKDFLLRCAADGVDINILLKVADRNINPYEMLGLIELYLKVDAP